MTAVLDAFYALLPAILLVMIYWLKDKVRHLELRVRDLDDKMERANNKLERLDLAVSWNLRRMHGGDTR